MQGFHFPTQLILTRTVYLVAIIGWAGLAMSQETAKKISVVANMLEGPTIQGTLMSGDSAKCSIETSNGLVEKSSNDVAQMRLGNPMDAERLSTEVLLLDGSKAFGDQLLGKSNQWQLKNARSGDITVPSDSLKAARLKPIPNKLQASWQTALSEPSESDAVIVMRGDSLERINGIIVQVQESKVAFDLDGQQIEVPIEKLFGLVWFRRPLERIRPTIEIASTNYSVWMAESFMIQAGSLELKTQMGQVVSIPLSSVESINYSTANLRWLSELEVLEAVAAKRIDFKGTVTGLEKAMSPRFVVNDRAPKPNSAPSDKDLYFPSPGRLVFRVPEGFKTFQSKIIRTDDGSQRTDLTIELWQDDQRIDQQTLAHNQDSIELNVAVQANKKTRLVVACISKLFIGTEVQWKQPRLKR
jgi:hypothetical protein